MALNTKISAAAAIAMADAIVDLIDAGAGAGYIEIVSGTQPADPDAALTGTVLATITLNDPAFAGAVDAGGSATATCDIAPAVEDTSADATGTATHFRAYDSNNNAIIDGSCGTSDADMIMDTVSVTAGQTITVTSWVITQSQG